ncbi:MAG TPA: hypothetical protein VFH42_08040 [Sporolactobacillaceae bacterium]|nr:hypothetical protein [Sporolactobacillaceae bacterium]
MKKKMSRHEAILWNVAMPGFGQLQSGNYLKGFLFIFLEFLINSKSHFNLGIMYSFQGDIARAASVIDYQWLMFYPCVYMFSMWDAFRDADPPSTRYSYLPFVFGAFYVTVGLMYSSKITIFGVNWGPVFLPMAFLIPGLMTGWIIQWIIRLVNKNSVPPSHQAE